MSPLVWVAMPVVVTVLATLWALWASRDRGRTDAYESVRAYHRFHEALSRHVPPVDPIPGGGRPDSRPGG
jgi:hypothetical protein